MNELVVFNNEQFGSVRTLVIDNEPWFVGKDVAEALGYSNPSKAVMVHVDGEDKRKVMLRADSQNGNVVTETTIINQSGLFSLILSSKLPEAKKFKHWVTSEILPSINKRGAYMTEETIEKALTSPDFLIKLATELKHEKEARQLAEEKIEADKPKVIFADTVSTSKQSILIGELAKLIAQKGVNIGQNRLFKWMRENGYLMQRGGNPNYPTQKSTALKVLEVKERTINNPDGSTRLTFTTKVTGKGQVYFVNKFLNSNNVQVEE